MTNNPVPSDPDAADKARGGSTPHIVRYVLIISLLLAILALSAIWITGALVTPEEQGAAGSAVGETNNPL